MKVIFEYMDKSGEVITENKMEKELTQEEVMVILNSNEIAYPVNNGFLFITKSCVVENSIYDMFTEPYKLRICVKEKQ